MLYVSQLFILERWVGFEPTMAAWFHNFAVSEPYDSHFYRAAVLPLDDHRIRARGETRTHDHGFNRPKKDNCCMRLLQVTLCTCSIQLSYPGICMLDSPELHWSGEPWPLSNLDHIYIPKERRTKYAGTEERTRTSDTWLLLNFAVCVFLMTHFSPLLYRLSYFRMSITTYHITST